MRELRQMSTIKAHAINKSIWSCRMQWEHTWLTELDGNAECKGSTYDQKRYGITECVWSTKG
eukprot:1158092-Pelagomonas_calceolata.AAC.6